MKYTVKHTIKPKNFSPEQFTAKMNKYMKPIMQELADEITSATPVKTGWLQSSMGLKLKEGRWIVGMVHYFVSYGLYIHENPNSDKYKWISKIFWVFRPKIRRHTFLAMRKAMKELKMME
ncbi:MAG: hypothetical protein HAW67_00185 [Endozoicomonadaceae bacterium]|nr:hypothetical protein [Endozoicomonadaceae bacterium]